MFRDVEVQMIDSDSSISVELLRLFSIMNVVRTKLRNRMQCEMVDSILCVRYGLMLREDTCHTFTVAQDMLSRFNIDMYRDDKTARPVEDSDYDDAYSVLLQE